MLKTICSLFFIKLKSFHSHKNSHNTILFSLLHHCRLELWVFLFFSFHTIVAWSFQFFTFSFDTVVVWSFEFFSLFLVAPLSLGALNFSLFPLTPLLFGALSFFFLFHVAPLSLGALNFSLFPLTPLLFETLSFSLFFLLHHCLAWSFEFFSYTQAQTNHHTSTFTSIENFRHMRTMQCPNWGWS